MCKILRLLGVLTCAGLFSGCAGYVQAEWCLERNEEGQCYETTSSEPERLSQGLE